MLESRNDLEIVFQALCLQKTGVFFLFFESV